MMHTCDVLIVSLTFATRDTLPRLPVRWGMWTPGIIGLVIGMLLLFAIKDDPEAGGFSAIDEPTKGGSFESVFQRDPILCRKF